MKRIKLLLLPTRLPAQHRIAATLSAYDALIENNRRRIQLLEQAARLLYKEWFVSLRFPRTRARQDQRRRTGGVGENGPLLK